MSKIRELILEMADVEELMEAAEEELNSGTDALEVIEVLSGTLKEVGERYERGKFFLSELIMAGYLASEVSDLLKPRLFKAESKPSIKVVIGTVKGDIHDIGKNIVIMMLEAAGIEVVDLGVDVSKERFIEAIVRHRPDVLGISALLTSTTSEVKEVIELLGEEGLRDRVKVIVGGRPVTREFSEKIGADGYAEDSVRAIELVKQLVN